MKYSQITHPDELIESYGPTYCGICGAWPARQTERGRRCHICECREWCAEHPVPMPRDMDVVQQLSDLGHEPAIRYLSQASLLECPFCGELPEYKPWTQGQMPEYHWPHQIVHNCKILGQQICVRAHKVGMPDTKESVFSIWNTRFAGNPSKTTTNKT